MQSLQNQITSNAHEENSLISENISFIDKQIFTANKNGDTTDFTQTNSSLDISLFNANDEVMDNNNDDGLCITG